MPIVMLRRDWPGQFRRVIRDEEGKPVEPERVLMFSPGESVECEDGDMPSLARDVQLKTLIVNAVLKVEKVAVEPTPEEPDAKDLPGRHRGRRN